MSVHYVPARKPTPDIMGAVLEAKVGPEQVELESIQTNGGTQMRAGLNAETVGEYMQTLKDSDQAWPFPPVVVFFDGEVHWLGDGFHRVAAARQLGRTGTIPCEVRAGDRRAAVLYAAGANADHGLRRTNADKRRSVEVLLRDQEWAGWSDREIARICKVTHPFVALMRKELSGNDYQMQAERTVTRGGVTYTQNVSNIGTNQPTYQAIWQLERIVARVQREHDALAEIMRAGAQHGIGSFWGECQRQAKAAGEYRLNDLRQAVNNVAAQMEAKAAGTNYPPGDPHSFGHIKIGPQAATNLDPWAVALATPGSRQHRSEALARAITPWIREYRDVWGRSYREIENISHSSGIFWHKFNEEADRRGASIRTSQQVDMAKEAIKQAVAWLLAEEPPKTEPAPPEIWVCLACGTIYANGYCPECHSFQQQAAASPEEAASLSASVKARLSAPPAHVSNPVPEPVVNRNMTPVLLKGILRQWLGERYAEQDDPAWFMYQMLDDWMHQDELHHLDAFKATLQPGWPVEWLDQAISELHAHFAPDEAEAEEQTAPQDTAQPVVSLNDLVVVDSVTGPTESENPLDSYDEKEASIAAKRMNKLHTLKMRFGETVDLLEDFGELTGRNTAALLAKRELAHLIDILDAEMDELQKGMRGA